MLLGALRIHAMRADERAPFRAKSLDWQYKGFPSQPGGEGITLETLPEQEWNILDGDLLLPVAVLKESALERNLELMSRYLMRA